MKLLRDFIDGRICFYWAAEIGMQLSPLFATRQDAEEWWKTFRFSQYQGPERRCSIYDRRSHTRRRRLVPPGQANTRGRRETDRLVAVDQDLASEKIEAWKVLSGIRGDHQPDL